MQETEEICSAESVSMDASSVSSQRFAHGGWREKSDTTETSRYFGHRGSSHYAGRGRHATDGRLECC